MSDDDEVLTIAGLRVRSSDALVERLDDPKTVASLLDLLDALPTLSGTLQMLDGFYTHSEHILENMRGSLIDVVGMTAQTPEVDTAKKLLKLGQQAVPVATKVADSGVLEKAADSGLLEKAADGELLATLGTLIDAVNKAKADAASGPALSKPGVLGLMSALKDPDTARGLDFALRVLKELGASLAHPTGTTRTTGKN